MNIVVGAVIALIVIADIAYIIHQRRKGVSSCGCSGCSGCDCECGTARVNVTFDEGTDRRE